MPKSNRYLHLISPKEVGYLTLLSNNEGITPPHPPEAGTVSKKISESQTPIITISKAMSKSSVLS